MKKKNAEGWVKSRIMRYKKTLNAAHRLSARILLLLVNFSSLAKLECVYPPFVYYVSLNLEPQQFSALRKTEIVSLFNVTNSN